MAAQENPVGEDAEVMLDEQAIANMRDTTTEALNKLKAEMKAQRLADANGAIGWNMVKGKKLVPFSKI